MPVQRDENGRRYVAAEVEVPGSPEEVWHAIATGSGISSWFVPTKSDEREGGTIECSFGPGMDSIEKITEWDPPRRYITGSGDSPETVASEWTVEARSGGTCIVRVVHRWFADSDDWDTEFETHAYGWATSYFRLLQLYLTHFSGQECSAVDLSAFSSAPPAQTWRSVTSAFRFDSEAQRVTSAPGAPAITGAVENAEVTDPDLLRIRERSPMITAAFEGLDGETPDLLLRLDRPAPGLAHIFIMPMGEQTMISIRFFLYGETGAAAASNVEQEWSNWLAARFRKEAPT